MDIDSFKRLNLIILLAPPRGQNTQLLIRIASRLSANST